MRVDNQFFRKLMNTINCFLKHSLSTLIVHPQEKWVRERIVTWRPSFLKAHKGLLLEIFPPVAFARQGIAWLLLEISLPYRLLATA